MVSYDENVRKMRELYASASVDATSLDVSFVETFAVRRKLITNGLLPEKFSVRDTIREHCPLLEQYEFVRNIFSCFLFCVIFSPAAM